MSKTFSDENRPSLFIFCGWPSQGPMVFAKLALSTGVDNFTAARAIFLMRETFCYRANRLGAYDRLQTAFLDRRRRIAR